MIKWRRKIVWEKRNERIVWFREGPKFKIKREKKKLTYKKADRKHEGHSSHERQQRALLCCALAKKSPFFHYYRHFLESRTLKRLPASNKETVSNTLTESSSSSSISFQDTVWTNKPTETVAPSFIKLYNKYTLVSNSFVRILFVYNISRIFSHAIASKSNGYERKRTWPVPWSTAP